MDIFVIFVFEVSRGSSLRLLREFAAVVSRYLKLKLSFGASRGGSIAPRLFGHPLEST